MHGETRKYEVMRRIYWYAAMTEDAAQRSRWTFYEVVNFGFYCFADMQCTICILYCNLLPSNQLRW
jgi:hypothetical protein